MPIEAATALFIRVSAHELYEAFVDPAITRNFWFSDGSARLDAGSDVVWTWAMYGASTQVEVLDLEPGRRILIEWDAGTPDASTVEWLFSPKGDGTFVEVRNFDLAGNAEEQTARAMDSVGGFSLVLAGAKAWLEHGLRLGLVEARHPDMLVPGWRSRIDQ